jgi:hypothetical protein
MLSTSRTLDVVGSPQINLERMVNKCIAPPLAEELTAFASNGFNGHIVASAFFL